MTLAEFHADLRRTNELLERLCQAVEFAAGMRPVVAKPIKQAGLEDISRISNVSTLAQEIERELEHVPGRGGKADG